MPSGWQAAFICSARRLVESEVAPVNGTFERSRVRTTSMPGTSWSAAPSQRLKKRSKLLLHQACDLFRCSPSPQGRHVPGRLRHEGPRVTGPVVVGKRVGVEILGRQQTDAQGGSCLSRFDPSRCYRFHHVSYQIAIQDYNKDKLRVDIRYPVPYTSAQIKASLLKFAQGATHDHATASLNLSSLRRR